MKFHVIKYKILLGKLLTLTAEGFFEKSQQNYLLFLSQLKSLDLIINSSDFLWSLVHRLDSAIVKGDKEEIEKTYIFFLLNAFDSFYILLPNDSKIQFYGIGENEVILSKLGLSLSSYEKGITIIKNTETLLEYIIDEFEKPYNGSYMLNLKDIPAWFKLRRDIICGRIAVIYQRHLNIFEEHYYLDCCDNIYLGHALKIKIEKAFDKIRETNGELFEKLISSIDYIIPYGHNPEKVYPNFAIATLKRTIFLSINLLSQPIIHIAECIIHEYGHCELHRVQDTVLLTHTETNVLEYYSPWRKDIRPLLGLIHAIYISYELVCFYSCYIDKYINERNEEVLLVKEKLETLIHQILIALKQIKKHQLTEFTLTLVNTILNSTREYSAQLLLSSAYPPQEVINHIKIWKAANPDGAFVE